MRIYIAGPLNGKHCTNYLANVHRFMVADVVLRSAGHAPFNPALDLLVGIMDGGMEYKDYFTVNLSWLEVSDALLYLAPSPGADVELKLAQELGLKIYYSLEEVPEA